MKKKYYLLVFLIISIILGILSSKFIYFQMDEFHLYHPLGCIIHSLNREPDIMRFNTCKYLDISFLPDIFYNSPFLPLINDGDHTGYPASVFGIIPLLLFKKLYIVRIIGVFLLGIQSLAYYKIFKINPYVIFSFFILFVAYFWQHVADAGLVAFPITFLTTAILLTDKIKKEIKFHCYKKIYAVFVGLLLFFTIYNKLPVLIIIPSIFIFIFVDLCCLLKTKIGRTIYFPKVINCLSLIFISFIIPTFLLLTAKNRQNFSYLDTIISNIPHGSSYTVQSIGNTLYNVILTAKEQFLKLLVYRLFNPLMTVMLHKNIFYLEKNLFFIFIFLIPLISFFLCQFLQIKHKKNIIYTIILSGVCFSLTILLASISKRSYGVHHLIPAYIFVIYSFASIYKRYSHQIIKKTFLAFFTGSLLILSSIYLNYKIIIEKHLRPSDKELPQMHRFLNTYAPNDILVFVDWGGHYTQTTVGTRNQAVIFTHDNPEDFIDMKKLSIKYKKNLIFIFLKKNNAFLQKITVAFPNITELKDEKFTYYKFLKVSS